MGQINSALVTPAGVLLTVSGPAVDEMLRVVFRGEGLRRRCSCTVGPRFCDGRRPLRGPIATRDGRGQASS